MPTRARCPRSARCPRRSTRRCSSWPAARRAARPDRSGGYLFAETLMVCAIPAWMVQTNEYLPAVLRVREKVPSTWAFELNLLSLTPSGALTSVTLWSTAPVHVHVTLVLRATVFFFGLKKLSPMLTASGLGVLDAWAAGTATAASAREMARVRTCLLYTSDA